MHTIFYSMPSSIRMKTNYHFNKKSYSFWNGFFLVKDQNGNLVLNYLKTWVEKSFEFRLGNREFFGL